MNNHAPILYTQPDMWRSKAYIKDKQIRSGLNGDPDRLDLSDPNNVSVLNRSRSRGGRCWSRLIGGRSLLCDLRLLLVDVVGAGGWTFTIPVLFTACLSDPGVSCYTHSSVMLPSALVNRQFSLTLCKKSVLVIAPNQA